MYGLINKMQIIASALIVILLQRLLYICLWKEKSCNVLFVPAPPYPPPKIMTRVGK
jgi:hypothetical protein